MSRRRTAHEPKAMRSQRRRPRSPPVARNIERATIAVTAGGFTRCAMVTFEVTYVVPTITLPFVGGFGDGMRVRSAPRRDRRSVSQRPRGRGRLCVIAEQDRGSVLALVPAGLLVLVLLAAIAVDTSVAYLGRRELAAAADAAANDAVTYRARRGALSRDRPVRARSRCAPRKRYDERLVVRQSDVVDRAAVEVTTDADAGTVTVTLRSSVDLVFSPRCRARPRR